MLHALLIRSANDAAYAVAVHIGGSVQGFARLMNERAKLMGCKNTKFNNPHGLNDPHHISTARDLAIMAREAMKNPDFQRAAGTRVHVISRSINQDDLWLVSKNKILKYDVTADGVKTGYTIPAGHCYVGSATRNGYRFISVILGSTKEWTADHKALMGWAFKNFKRTCLEQPGQVLRDVPLSAGEAPIRAVVNEPVFYAHDKSAAPQLQAEIVPKPGLALPIPRSAEVGIVTFSDGRGWRFSTPLYAADDFEQPPILRLGSASAPGPITALFACILGGGALWMRKKARTMFSK
jgi:D-alanyl-D-alanine carboxypeptidase (penicillin-binding protein 5/6)